MFLIQNSNMSYLLIHYKIPQSSLLHSNHFSSQSTHQEFIAIYTFHSILHVDKIAKLVFFTTTTTRLNHSSIMWRVFHWNPLISLKSVRKWKIFCVGRQDDTEKTTRIIWLITDGCMHTYTFHINNFNVIFIFIKIYYRNDIILSAISSSRRDKENFYLWKLMLLLNLNNS